MLMSEIKIERHPSAYILMVLAPVVLYISISLMGFEYRNPLCNRAAIFRHFISVISWKRLPQYQTSDNDFSEDPPELR